MASVHSKLRMESAAMTRRMLAAVENPLVDILGHCTGRKVVGRGRPQSSFDHEASLPAPAPRPTPRSRSTPGLTAGTRLRTCSR